ncbi:MAG: hypothetical protein LJE87_15885 [Deltaproteobacteria bacterium]|nr:hypothetical protein [Deltaproteobacteria bacterium]
MILHPVHLGGAAAGVEVRQSVRRIVMQRRGQSGPRQGGGGRSSSGSGGGGRARRGSLGGGSNGECVCPSCGEKTTHQRGVPCKQTHCPACGTVMSRER